MQRIRTALQTIGPLIKALLQPDEQILDAQGRYAPNPSGASADSMSIGLGFSAKAASY